MKEIINTIFSPEGDPVSRMLYIMFSIILVIGSLFGLWKIPGINQAFKRNNKTKEKKKEEYIKNPHTTCPYYRDLLAIMERVTARGELLTRQAVTIELKSTLREQMKEAEAYVLKMKLLSKKIWLKHMRDHNNGKRTGLMKKPEVISYLSQLKEISHGCEDLLRVRIGQNHFIDKNDNDFEKYINNVFNELRSYITEELDDNWYDFYPIAREDIYKIHEEEILPEAKREFREMFFMVRDIAREKREQKDEIYKMKNEYTARELAGERK